MNSLAIVSLLALLPVCLTTNCYVCNPGSSGCDPFSSGGAGVSTTSLYTNCYKVTTGSASGTYRGGSSACSASSGLLSTCSAYINCYSCSYGTDGCFQFSVNGRGISVYSNNVCVKFTNGTSLTTIRYPYYTCPGSNDGTVGTFCCMTDYCNGVTSKYQISSLFQFVLAAVLVKLQLNSVVALNFYL
ncbi:unnamed protein product [Adineta ricciae]|uniref:Uncharacterized protein n=1 Tax=Adineta ricciae TaxID=249248 RepID=A0A815Q640_ADIRI|nr:unnamed protein product [Adineta ricciae]